jgi:hypothetical protein
MVPQVVSSREAALRPLLAETLLVWHCAETARTSIRSAQKDEIGSSRREGKE